MRRRDREEERERWKWKKGFLLFFFSFSATLYPGWSKAQLNLNPFIARIYSIEIHSGIYMLASETGRERFKEDLSQVRPPFFCLTPPHPPPLTDSTDRIILWLASLNVIHTTRWTSSWNNCVLLNSLLCFAPQKSSLSYPTDDGQKRSFCSELTPHASPIGT